MVFIMRVWGGRMCVFDSLVVTVSHWIEVC